MKKPSRANCILSPGSFFEIAWSYSQCPTPSVDRGTDVYIRYCDRQRGVPGTIRPPGVPAGYPLPRVIFSGPLTADRVASGPEK